MMKRFAGKGSALDREDRLRAMPARCKLSRHPPLAVETRHNARQHGAKVLSTPFASVPKLYRSHREDALFSAESFEGDGEKPSPRAM